MDIGPTRDQLKISTRVLYDELVRQNTGVEILDEASSLLEYTSKSGKKHLLFSTCSDKSSATGVIIANNKARTATIARRMGIPTPEQVVSRDIREIRKFLSDMGRVVIKPIAGSSGAGVTTNITSQEALERAYLYAKTFSLRVVAQRHIMGSDIRLLIVGGKFCSAVMRKPAHVIGDGESTIEMLINEANADMSRNDDSQSSLMHINMSAAVRFLGDDLQTILEDKKEARVVGPANVSLGGSLHEATHLVPAAMIADAEAITNKLGLGMCGVDVMWDRKTNNHYLIEANATPGIDIHDDPFSGTSSDAVERYVQWLIAE
ncbi:MAG TPA: ATP-grasp domain-containing protein [Candidatus Saccharimonadales bacterium]|nr:ATP-grasp domain-containing protein [Candidatus Saccharimonadales bacterium]